jgi:hypothetical protein
MAQDKDHLVARISSYKVQSKNYSIISRLHIIGVLTNHRPADCRLSWPSVIYNHYNDELEVYFFGPLLESVGRNLGSKDVASAFLRDFFLTDIIKSFSTVLSRGNEVPFVI